MTLAGIDNDLMPIIIKSFLSSLTAMPQPPRLRPVFCLGAVLGLHLFLIGLFLAKPGVVSETAPRISIMWLIPETVKVAKINPGHQAVNHRPSAAMTVPEQKAAIETPTLSVLPQAPTLDLEAMHQLAVREALKPDGPSIVMQNGLSGADHSLEAHIDRAAKRAQHSDCRTAHSGAGLFAPFVIAADLMRDKGCKF